MKEAVHFSVIFCLVLLATAGEINAQDIRIIVRGDDMGMTQGSLAAYEKAFNEGVLTCASHAYRGMARLPVETGASVGQGFITG